MNTKRKGIILAGGTGSRLYPSTHVISKQLLPVFDKPMIYYPLSTLMLAGIREILIICTPDHIGLFKSLLGDGNQWGLDICYEIQIEPKGLVDAFKIGKNFIDNNPCALILGDNIFHANDMVSILSKANNNDSGAKVFAYRVVDPHRFGIVEFDNDHNVISIEEKPKHPKSNYAVTGLYFYNSDVCKFAEEIMPSSRGELEITDLNNIYLQQKNLSVELMGRGVAWLDTGTHESLLQAGSFISTLQNRQGLMIGCPEEIAYTNDWIDSDQMYCLASEISSPNYKKYLLDILDKE